MALLQSLPNLRKNFAARYSPWMLIGVTLILALAITVLAVRNAQRERAYMSQNLMNRADALIWAVEAGTRASMGMGMRNGAQNVQAIVEETAQTGWSGLYSRHGRQGESYRIQLQRGCGKTFL